MILPSRLGSRGLFSPPDRWAAQAGGQCDDDQRPDDGQADDQDIAPESDVVVDDGWLRRRIGRKLRRGGGVVPGRWIGCGGCRQGRADVPSDQECKAAELSQADLGHRVSFAPGGFTGCDEGPPRERGHESGCAPNFGLARPSSWCSLVDYALLLFLA